MNNSKPSLSARELARRWRIPISTLRQWRWRKKALPPSRKAERQTLYDLKDVEAFEEKILSHHTTMTSNSSKKAP